MVLSTLHGGNEEEGQLTSFILNFIFIEMSKILFFVLLLLFNYSTLGANYLPDLELKDRDSIISTVITCCNFTGCLTGNFVHNLVGFVNKSF